MGLSKTQIKIIEAAEIEFAEMGYAGASIREITNRAGVNIAAINYHFGSKETLYKEMVLYHIEPINAVRMELLDEALAKNESKPLPLEQVVDIIVRPLLSTLISESCNKFHFMRAMGKGMGEERDFMKDIQKDLLKDILPKFISAISDSLGNPHFEKIAYGMHFLTCSIVGAMMQHTRLGIVSGGQIDLNDVDGLVDHLVAFISAGLKAVSEVNPIN